MIKSAMRVYFTSKCTYMTRQDAIRKVSKLFRCPVDKTSEIYDDWRKDYVVNKINII